MGKYAEIDAMINDALDRLQRFADRTLEELNKETRQAAVDISREFGEWQQNRITDLFNAAVDEFYDAYSPSYYERQYGLYKVLSLPVDENGMVITDSPGYTDLFDPSLLHRDRNGGDLFNKVFMEGWHGGAESISPNKSDVWGEHPSPGTPYYRKPGFVKYPNSTKKVMHRYGKWGKMAYKSKSAYQIFSENLGRAEGGEIFEMFKEISTRHNKEAVDRVIREMPRIKAEIYG